MSTVSIIVPVYNAQNYLHKCIDSLLAQSFCDFELILVNDGSKDNSGAICDEYAKKDRRIRVIHKENGGVSSARNIGMDTACGKYIMFCDSDDYIAAEFCEPLIKLADGNDNCLVMAGITEIRDGGSLKDSLCPSFAEGETVHLTKQEFCDLYVKHSLNKPFALLNMPYNKLFSRRVIEDHGLRFDQNIHYNEDLVFSLDYLDKVEDIRFYNKSIYNYYLDAPGSLCKRYFENIIDMFRIKETKLKSVVLDKSTDTAGAHRVWCTMVFDDTNRAINNTFSPSNPASEKEKTRYCTALIRDKRFKEALKGADTKGYNQKYIKLLRFGSFGLIRLLKR